MSGEMPRPRSVRFMRLSKRSKLQVQSSESQHRKSRGVNKRTRAPPFARTQSPRRTAPACCSAAAACACWHRTRVSKPGVNKFTPNPRCVRDEATHTVRPTQSAHLAELLATQVRLDDAQIGGVDDGVADLLDVHAVRLLPTRGALHIAEFASDTRSANPNEVTRTMKPCSSRKAKP